MLVSLYTVRVVLETLGTEDYGIYNAVAGVVGIFGFLSGAIAGTSQRFLSIEIGNGNFEQLRKVFSLSLMIYAFFALLVILLSETIGLWFVTNKLNLPSHRRTSALWVYHFSIISLAFTFLTMPYMATIIAHENMNIYAYISVAEAVLKLGVVFILRLVDFDKLKIYGTLMCIVVFGTTVLYTSICTIKYQECQFGFYWDKELQKKITGFTFFSIVVNISHIIKNHGITILINQFYNPMVIVARGIAVSVNSAVSSFSFNFRTAATPQITKSFGTKSDNPFDFVFFCSKCTFFLMLIFSLPLFIEMDFILLIWLKNPPEYTSIFIRMAILEVLIISIYSPLCTAIEAIGKIKLYYSIHCGIGLLNFPVSLLILMLDVPPYYVMIVSIFLTIIFFFFILIFLKHLTDFSVTDFLKNVIFRSIVAGVLSSVLPTIIFTENSQGVFRLLLITITNALSIFVCMYLFGLNKNEKTYVTSILLFKIKRIKVR
jgi:O-antigen/teichoic acid export membrane protein